MVGTSKRREKQRGWRCGPGKGGRDPWYPELTRPVKWSGSSRKVCSGVFARQRGLLRIPLASNQVSILCHPWRKCAKTIEGKVCSTGLPLLVAQHSDGANGMSCGDCAGTAVRENEHQPSAVAEETMRRRGGGGSATEAALCWSDIPCSPRQ